MTSDYVYRFITDLSVPGVDKDRYIVTLGGVIFDLKMQRYPKTFIDEFGYEKIHLHTENGFKIVFVHRIMAIEFVGFHPNLEINQVDHIDTIKSHNELYNLEWVYPYENTHRALANDLCPHINNVVTEEDVHFICQQLSMGKSYGEISDMLFEKTHTDLRIVIGDIYRGSSWKDISIQYIPFPETLDKSYYLDKRAIPKNSVLTEQMVHEICQRLENGERSIDIASDMEIKYNLSKPIEDIIGGIRQGRNWKKISSQYNIPKGSNCRKDK